MHASLLASLAEHDRVLGVDQMRHPQLVAPRNLVPLDGRLHVAPSVLIDHLGVVVVAQAEADSHAIHAQLHAVDLLFTAENADVHVDVAHRRRECAPEDAGEVYIDQGQAIEEDDGPCLKSKGILQPHDRL